MSSDSALTIVCLCAGWCGVCRDYRPVFDAAARRDQAVARFVWLDIEDDAERVGEIEVETFPTILVVRGAATLFAGPVAPPPAILARLVEQAAADRLAPLAAPPPGAAALAAWLSGESMPRSG